jgi:hypothetical protein
MVTNIKNSTITIERDALNHGYTTTFFVADEDLIRCQNHNWSRLIDEAFERFQQDVWDILGFEQVQS